MRLIHSGGVLLGCALLANLAYAEERRIEEMVVTAEKRQSTVSDTSISITAFSESMLEEQGIQNANEFVNFIPATTRDNYDIRIRGVGRNFRNLGGDPGVATYYNGVYSEDALIALTEGALWDLERIEVLRGPQGTLYGRNSIGGAINYITKRPSENFEGELRTQVGEHDTLEVYGLVSGPLTEDLGYRLNASKRSRNGWQEGQFGTQDVDSTNDQNVSLSLEWKPTDNITIFTRANDRRSLRRIGTGMIFNEGWGARRGTRSTDLYAYGLRDVTDGALPQFVPGVEAITNPRTGETRWGAPIRPGIDPAASSFPNPEFGSTVYDGRGYLNDGGPQKLDDDIEPEAYTNGLNDEEFDQQAISLEVNWDLDNLTLKYLFGYNDFLYTYDTDGGFSNSKISDPGARVAEEIYSYSHELTLIWDVNEDLNITAGLYNFYSNRLQDFSFQNRFNQGRLGQPQDLGLLDVPNLTLGGLTVMQAAGIGPAVGLGDAPMGFTIAGQWDGSFDELGSTYRHKNKNETTQYAAYVQGTWQMSDQFALTLGARWARDEKEVLENRGGYFESNFMAGFYPAVNAAPFLWGLSQAQVDAIGAEALVGVVPGAGGFPALGLALQNVLMGSATATGIVGNPIAPVCDLSATRCANPLRLQGVPLSWTGLAQDDDEWSDVSWRVNLDWTPNEDHLMYFSVTTGYRSGGYALGAADARIDGPTGTVPLSYDEEGVIAYEIGWKATFMDGSLQMNSSIYRYDYEDYQDNVTIFDPIQNAFRAIATNTGDAINQGFEVEVTWLATDSLTLNANYSFTDTEYQDQVFFIDDDDPTRPAPLFGVGVIDIEGNNLKGIPEHKATVWGTYEWATDIGKIIAGASVSYTGEYYPEGVERALDEIPDRLRTDMSVSWYSVDEKIRARLFVDNVFDERMLRGVGTGSIANHYRLSGTLLYPRYWGLDVRWQFGG